MTISIIAIQGEHSDKISEIIRCFGYIDLDKDSVFDNPEQFHEYLSKHYTDSAVSEIGLRGLWFENGWTIFSDPEMVDAVDDEALLKLSNKLNSEVLTFIVQSTSGAYGFAKYGKIKQRHFFSIDGEITENLGSPLHEEQGVLLSENVCIDDILKLATKFGIDPEGKSTKSFIVKRIGYSDEMKRELKQVETNHKPGINKPWWKIW